MKYITKSEKETQNLATLIANDFKKGGVIALMGELGAGKTTFVQGFAKGLRIKDKIISPTFVLIRIHRLPARNATLRSHSVAGGPKSMQKLFHIDLYRLEGTVDLKQIGIEEIISEPKNIVLIEWADKILDQLPKNTIKITFKKVSESAREIEVI